MFSFRNCVFIDPNLEPCVDRKQPIFLLCPICEELLAWKLDCVKRERFAVSSALKGLTVLSQLAPFFKQ